MAYVSSMEMIVNVDISLENKKVTGTVNVTESDWNTDALASVLDALNSQHHLELSKFYDDKNVVVRSGDIVGRLDMPDLTEQLELEPLERASAWITIDITDSGEVQVDDGGNETLELLRSKFPVLEEYSECPICLMPEPLYSLVVHLNDLHHYTRHDIADFLEGLDANLEISH